MAYLDENTYEVVDNIIEIDDEMVPIIQELHRKGYKTNGCVGAIKDLQHLDLYSNIVPEDKVDDYIDSLEGDYIDLGSYEDNEVISCIDTWSTISITFGDLYEFPSIPEDFGFGFGVAQTADGRFINFGVLAKDICLYEDEENKIFKTKEGLEKEINETYRELLEWAKSLEPLDEMKLKREK